MVFSWDDWNVEHIAGHGVTPYEAEYVVKHAAPPFPHEVGDEKYRVWGRTDDGRFLQVIFVYRSDDDVDYESLDLEELLAVEEGEGPLIYVVHAMDLTQKMKRQFRRLMG
ncbi:MAG TPA: hypothetical protein VLJ39_12415 [Tepidisphaeraceae bacterium]|nr:hypothetical protein [Tepidisphaeraceae bacterium]